jgi:hypothetical protein
MHLRKVFGGSLFIFGSPAMSMQAFEKTGQKVTGMDTMAAKVL